jgi:hypothetical protein
MSTEQDSLKLKIDGKLLNVSEAEIPRLIEALKQFQENSQNASKQLLIDNLGWTSEEAAEAYARLQSFQEDWDLPEMDVYDHL